MNYVRKLDHNRTIVNVRKRKMSERKKAYDGKVVAIMGKLHHSCSYALNLFTLEHATFIVDKNDKYFQTWFRVRLQTWFTQVCKRGCFELRKATLS